MPPLGWSGFALVGAPVDPSVRGVESPCAGDGSGGDVCPDWCLEVESVCVGCFAVQACAFGVDGATVRGVFGVGAVDEVGVEVPRVVVQVWVGVGEEDVVEAFGCAVAVAGDPPAAHIDVTFGGGELVVLEPGGVGFHV